MTAHSLAVGVYGKIGSQPDFLRANAGVFSQVGLDRWFQDAVEGLRTEGTQLPEIPTGFLWASAAVSGAFIGAFVPSTDAAGRSFPLVIFGQIANPDLADSFPSIPSIHDGFVRAAGAVALGGRELSGPELVSRVESVGETFRSAPAGAQIVLDDESAHPLFAALGDAPGAIGYALRTFVSACDQVVKSGPTGTGGVITVDAPAPNPAVRELWLEIARRRLRWRDATPSLLWTDGAVGRLLMTLGPPSPAALSYLANPRHRASRFWPLRTDVTSAIDSAMKALTPEQRRRVENPPVSLGDLVSAFA